MHTLAFAYITGNVESHLLPVTSISAPIHEYVPDAIRACRVTGIDVKIDTSDTRGTSCKIARQLDMLSDEEASQRVERLNG